MIGLKIDTSVILPVTKIKSSDPISVGFAFNSIIGSAKAEIGASVAIKINITILNMNDIEIVCILIIPSMQNQSKRWN